MHWCQDLGEGVRPVHEELLVEGIYMFTVQRVHSVVGWMI